MSKFLELLRGKKTYIIGVLMIITGCLNNFDQEMIMTGFGFITLRAGLSATK